MAYTKRLKVTNGDAPAPQGLSSLGAFPLQPHTTRPHTLRPDQRYITRQPHTAHPPLKLQTCPEHPIDLGLQPYRKPAICISTDLIFGASPMATGHYLFYTEEDKLQEIHESGEDFVFPPARKAVTCFLIS